MIPEFCYEGIKLKIFHFRNSLRTLLKTISHSVVIEADVFDAKYII